MVTRRRQFVKAAGQRPYRAILDALILPEGLLTSVPIRLSRS
jgi:hypothetical protein